MASLLLIEDDENLSTMLKERLAEEGYSISFANCGKDARSIFEQANFDLVILDVGLPDESGFSIARTFREISNVPIIFLTAMNSAEYRLEGYEIGAEEYIPKPFHLRELLLKIERVLERNKVTSIIRSGNLTLDLNRRTIAFEDNSLFELSQRECEILRYLIEASPKSISREDLHKKIAGDDSSVSNLRSIDNTIVKLRGILKDKDSGSIRSIRGVGYLWENECH